MVHVQVLDFLKLVQEQHGIGRIVTVPLQLGNNVALAGDHALALHNMALGGRASGTPKCAVVFHLAINIVKQTEVDDPTKLNSLVFCLTRQRVQENGKCNTCTSQPRLQRSHIPRRRKAVRPHQVCSSSR
jgi:hypothetical protein